MKIKDLVALLKNYDPELEFTVQDADGYIYHMDDEGVEFDGPNVGCVNEYGHGLLKSATPDTIAIPFDLE